MELLILSKLQWDLTAITAYDYLDHLLHVLEKSEVNTSNPEEAPVDNDDDEDEVVHYLLDPAQMGSLRKHTERLITLCATDPSFNHVPASMVASASLASAVQQDYESNPPTSGPTVQLNQIVGRIQGFTKIEKVRHVHITFLILGSSS